MAGVFLGAFFLRANIHSDDARFPVSAPDSPSAGPGPSPPPAHGGGFVGGAVRGLWQAPLPVPPRAEARTPLLPLLEGAGPEPVVVCAPGEGRRTAPSD